MNGGLQGEKARPAAGGKRQALGLHREEPHPVNLDSYLPELQERNQCHRLLTGNGLKRQGTGPAVCRRGRLREGGEKSVAQ